MDQHDDPDQDAEQQAEEQAEREADRAREVHLTMDLCLRIGEMLLSSGAGAADVTATMRSVADHMGLRAAEIDVTFTALSMSYQRRTDDVPVLMVRHVQQRDIDYEDLTAVDHLVRDVLTDRADLYLARSRMATIVSLGHAFPRWAVTIAWMVMAAAVGVFLGGGLVVSLVAAVAAALIDRVQIVLARRRLPYFYLQVAGGAIATLLAAAVASLGGPKTRITTVESDPRATEHAGENLAEWVGARAETGRVDRWLAALASSATAAERARLSQGVVVLDPPRAGAGPRPGPGTPCPRRSWGG